VVRDFHDFSCGFFDTGGNMLAHSTKTTTAFIGVMPYLMKHFLEHFDPDTLKPGDVMVTNDPWLGTGHTYDLCVASPTFHEGTLTGFALCIVHHLDVGGRMATTESKDMFEEGLRLPMLKLYSAGVLDPVLEAIIKANIREPDKVFGDIRAQVVANNVCSRGIARMVQDYALTPDDLEALAGEIVSRSENSLRRKISELPKGTFENEVTLPTIGNVSGINIRVAVTIADDEIEIDYEGSSGEVQAAVNVTFNMTRSYSLYPIKLAIDPEVPNNEGCLRPVKVRAPARSLLNCEPPAPTWGRTMICHNLPEIVFGALAKAMPERIMAGSGSTPLVFTYFRSKRMDGRTYVGITSSMGGMGATSRGDGPSCRGFPYNVGNIPVEVIEKDVPIIYRKKELIEDSGGPGKFRGGLGQECEIEVAGGELAPVGPLVVGIRGSGRSPDSPYPVFGRLGGQYGRGEGLTLNGKAIPHGPQQNLFPGDRLRIALPGGGGFGSPMERDPKAVASDVISGYVTADAALPDYGVVLDSKGCVTPDATLKQRQESKQKKALAALKSD
jgi:N-methylhydantoinase B